MDSRLEECKLTPVGRERKRFFIQIFLGGCSGNTESADYTKESEKQLRIRETEINQI